MARLATVLKAARTKRSITVAAGDLIGATPLESAYFLDEPTVKAMGLVGLELAAVGNHEFDKGSAELLRMQNGGCAKVSTIPSRLPCRLEPFAVRAFIISRPMSAPATAEPCFRLRRSAASGRSPSVSSA